MNKSVYDITALTLASLIVYFSTVSIFYSLKNFFVSRAYRENYPAIRHILPVVISCMWVLVFGFILFEIIILKEDIIDNTSFGTLFIRPVILLACIEDAIGRKYKYFSSLKRINELKKLQEEELSL